MASRTDEEATALQNAVAMAARGRSRLLIFWDGGFSSRPLPTNGELSIGRSQSCDVAIDHASVSRKHAILHLGEQPRIEDLGSSNGTRVGGVQLAAGSSAPLSAGDVCEVGSVMLVMQHPTSSGEPATALPLLTSAIVSPILTVMPPPPVNEPPMAALERLVSLVARGSISVLLLGETGVGKEVTAEKIHASSPRARGPFVRINAAALTETLLESELFGHEKGAFTGAVGAKSGLLEAADKGTFFFDEVGELPLTTQAKLLRVLESREVQRVGGLKPRPIDVRFIAATNRDLRAQCAAGAFREDLFFRLNGITVRIPPLRERTAEIPDLARLFLARACREMGSAELSLTPAAVQRLIRHRWPGNIRELKNVMDRAVLLAPGAAIDAADLPIEFDGDAEVATDLSSPGPSGHLRKEVADFERQRIIQALDECGGNQTKAARLLGISRRTLLTRLDEYDVPRPRK